jgi:hypothetical protein
MRYEMVDAPELTHLLLSVFYGSTATGVVEGLHRYLWRHARFGRCGSISVIRAFQPPSRFDITLDLRSVTFSGQRTSHHLMDIRGEDTIYSVPGRLPVFRKMTMKVRQRARRAAHVSGGFTPPSITQITPWWECKYEYEEVPLTPEIHAKLDEAMRKRGLGSAIRAR